MSASYRARDDRGRNQRQGREAGGGPAAAKVEGVVVNAYSEGWLRKDFPWVYTEEVVAARVGLRPGDAVAIHTRQGVCLGAGLWDEGKVAVRRFRADDGPIDAALIGDRLRLALSRRPLPPATTAWRWVHGESDDLPGVRLDVWQDHLALSLDSPSLLPLVDVLLDEASRLHRVDLAWLAWRLPADEIARVEGMPSGLVRGAPERQDEAVEVLEAGMRFRVWPGAGPDVGLFCDMRELRSWLAPHWAGARVLNLFAHTGAFSVAAAINGAAEVTSVDLSAVWLERLRHNLTLNGLDPAAHPTVEDDAFRALDRLRRTGESFDRVVLDPPSFSHGPQGTWSATQDLGRLVAGALRVLRPGGWLVAASNHGGTSPKEFQGHLLDGARKAGRALSLIHQGSPPPDFPAALSFPESRYLKCWVLEAR